ncbi:MAG: BA14K family protein [Aestuariivirga sp.]|uniref:BA14K family protein n=1 Tax=Aestuariivirga sp. TaxID=2650926 RepID=UPI0025C1ADAE|nr:BA14K family protein [Aestuariivirga sp.]MCA3562656.1 BA14K family protein [Aestuariivirga sp.]
MFRTILAPLLGLPGIAALAAGAWASDPYGTDKDGVKTWKPYVIEKTCADGIFECAARMDYTPFQRAMVARPGSYWYQKPFQVHRYGDFRPPAAQRHSGSSHEAWCSARYRSYDPATDTYVGHGYERTPCISP